MPRPRKCRYIETVPQERCFKPCKGTHSSLKGTMLFLDELEALRLGDLEGLSQEEAALRMEISRSTFARIINEAHRKIADAILFSKPIITEGGDSEAETRQFKCDECKHEWEMECGAGCPEKCPACKGSEFNRTNCGLRYQSPGACGVSGQQRPRGQTRCCGKTND